MKLRLGLIATALVALSGCSTVANYQCEAGKDCEAAKVAMTSCKAQVPEAIRVAATRVTPVETMTYIAGANGTGGSYIPKLSYVCQSACREARVEQDRLIAECMREKGWAQK